MATLVECSDGSGKLERSGSGFLLSAAEGLVVTSACWLEDFIVLPDTPTTRAVWHIKPAGATFTVTISAKDPVSLPAQCSACVLGVRCLLPVHAYLKKKFKDDKGATPSQRDTAAPTTSSQCNLVHLSSLVILKLSTPPDCR